MSTPVSRTARVNQRPSLRMKWLLIREDRDDEEEAKVAMRVIEVVHPGVDAEAWWVKKG